MEAWTLATALLNNTDRLHIGHLVLCDQFRHPAVLAKMALTLDQVSAGFKQKWQTAFGMAGRTEGYAPLTARRGETMSTAVDVDLNTVAELAAQLRTDSIRSSTSAGSGHPTSSMSAADLLAVLVARHFHYDWDNPSLPANDHLIFSKGHASPLVYSVFKAVGAISDEELMTGYRRFGQRLQGHPTPAVPWVDVATGSLGQGLPDGVGVALAGKYLDQLPYRVWVLCGDSELAEGSIWEAMDKASYYQLSNLITIVDVNRLGQRGETDLGWNTEAYARRFGAFGAHTMVIDGHDLAAIDAALSTAQSHASGDRPTVIIAKTIKGKGFSEVEDSPDWHGKPLPPDMAERAITELGGERSVVLRGPTAAPQAPHPIAAAPADVAKPRYSVGDKVATRKAYGQALAALGARDPWVVALDGEVSNSTYANEFAIHFPDRFFEMFIAEQQMVAAATGIAVRGYTAFASTFAAFFTRAYDFIRMGAISAGQPALGGVARRRGDRRRRPLPDGVGRPGDDARRARLDRALSQRRDKHRRVGQRDGRHCGNQLSTHHPRRLPGALRRRRTVPRRRIEAAAQ
jgi:transketolase